jgi:hypothetical protein
MKHTLVVDTEVLDQISKSLMQSLNANIKKRRRMQEAGQTRTRTYADATHEGELLTTAQQDVIAAQSASLAES